MSQSLYTNHEKYTIGNSYHLIANSILALSTLV